MVAIDFTNYTCFSSCPAWWRGFVNSLSIDNDRKRDFILNEALKPYNAIITDTDDPQDIEFLIFEDEIDFLAFKLRYNDCGI